MTKTFAVNKNNDLYIGSDGNLVIFSGIDAVLQVCEQAAKTLKSEIIFSVNQGIPMFETVFNGVPNLLQYESALRKAWRAVSGVRDILGVDVVIQNNILFYTATILTEFGQGVVNGEL